MLELPYLRAALLFLENPISLKNYVMSVVHEKSGESRLFRGRESFLSIVYSGSSLTWDWLVAYAEKKGLALQPRKMETLLSKRKKKIERSGLRRLRGLRLEFSSFRVFVLLPGSLIWLWLCCYERLIPLVFPILLYLKRRLVSLPICTASGAYIPLIYLQAG